MKNQIIFYAKFKLVLIVFCFYFLFLGNFQVFANNEKTVVIQDELSLNTIVVKNFSIKAQKLNNSIDKINATFYLEPGLNGTGYSFQSKGIKNYYLIYENNKLALSFKKGSDWFKKAATFNVKKDEKGFVLISSVLNKEKIISIKNKSVVFIDKALSSSSLKMFSIDIVGDMTDFDNFSIESSSDKNIEKKEISNEIVKNTNEEPKSDSWILKVFKKQAEFANKLFGDDEKVDNNEKNIPKKQTITKTNAKENTQKQISKTNSAELNTNGEEASFNLTFEQPDFKSLNSFVNTGTITTTITLLKQLYGTLSKEQEKQLYSQFQQYYQYPCDEVLEYFDNLNKQLYKAVVLKTRLSHEMEGYGYAAGEALNAYDYKNEEIVKSSLNAILRRRKNIIAIENQLSQINMHLNNMKDVPNALEIKKEREKLFDDILNEYANNLNNNNLQKQDSSDSGFDGIWKLDENSIIKVSSDKSGLKREKIKLSDMEKSYNKFSALSPFVSKKIYLKKVKELGNGFSLVYLYLDKLLDTTDDETISLIAKKVADSFGDFGNKNSKNYNDSYETLIVKQESKNLFTIKQSSSVSEIEGYPSKLQVKIEENQLICSHQTIYSDTSSEVFSFKFIKTDNPKKPKTLKNGNWDWDDLMDDYNDEVKEYLKLSESEKNIRFEDIDDDNYGTLQWKIAKIKKEIDTFSNSLNNFKGTVPSNIDEKSLVWYLKNAKLDKKTLSNTPDYVLEVTENINKGYIKVWRKNYETVGESYVSEGHEQLKDRVEVAQFYWNSPKNYMKKGEKWNIKLKNSGLINTSFKVVLPSIFKFRTSSSGTPQPFSTKEIVLDKNTIKMTEDIISKSDGKVQLQAKFYNKALGNWEIVKVDFQFELQAKEFKEDNKGNFIPNDADALFASKEDFYELQIQELKEDIENYKVMMEKESRDKEKQQIALLILGKEADMQQQMDLLNELKTGNFKHTATKWDKYNKVVSTNKFLEESHKYQERMDLIDKISKISGKLGEQADFTTKDWAQKNLTEAIKSNDNEKMNKIYSLMKDKYMSYYEKKQIDAELRKIDMEDYTERAKSVKSWAEFGVMAGTMGMASGSTYLYAGYTGLTNGISDGPKQGIKKAIASLNTVTMVAESAYDGYNTIDPNTGEKLGIKGARDHALFTLAVVGVVHLGIKTVVKGCSVSQKAFNKVRDKLVYQQEQKMTKEMLKAYENRINKFKQFMSKGESAAARQEMKIIEEETKKLMANPHAKNFLKYKGSKITSQYYQHCEKKIKKKVLDDFFKRMESKGWSKFQLKEFRNAASGSSVGMDWDIGLIESKGMKLTKGGRAASIQQWQNDATKEFNKAYMKQTGYTAEASFANITSSKNAEAFEDIAILSNPANARFEFAENTAKTVKYKADFMLSNHSKGFITQTGKFNEACRGMAKEIRTKLIPNLKNSRFKLHSTKGVKYFSKLQNVLDRFGKNEIGITQAEREVQNLTGKSLNELPELISTSLKNAIIIK